MGKTREGVGEFVRELPIVPWSDLIKLATCEASMLFPRPQKTKLGFSEARTCPDPVALNMD